jgi:hypothetical protein
VVEERFMPSKPDDELRERALQAIAQARREAEASEWLFLDAWKRGVALAGKEYFLVTVSDPASASDKNELRPNGELVEQTIGVLSSGQGVFLAAMCSFFNPRWGQSLLAGLGEHRTNICDISAALDTERRLVIAELFQHYNGW